MSSPGIGATHTIKVAPGTTPQQTQAIFNALHSQRQNNTQNLRLQSGGSLVAVTVQPQTQQQQQSQTQQTTNIIVSQANTIPANIDASSIVQSSQQNQTQQLQQSQQVRNIVKKRITSKQNQ